MFRNNSGKRGLDGASDGSTSSRPPILLITTFLPRTLSDDLFAVFGLQKLNRCRGGLQDDLGEVINQTFVHNLHNLYSTDFASSSFSRFTLYRPPTPRASARVSQSQSKGSQILEHKHKVRGDCSSEDGRCGTRRTCEGISGE